MLHWPLTNGLLGGEWCWPSEHKVYLLLDGVRVQDLPRRLYEWSAGRLEADLLYAGTPWSDVNDVSPWLVQLAGPEDPVLRHFLEDGLAPEWGYLIVSESDLAELGDHLRGLIQVVHPAGIPLLLRLADPAVIAALLEPESSPAQVPWGPMHCLLAPDAVAEEWRCWSPTMTDAAPVSLDHAYRLSEPQLERLRACDLRRDTRRLMAFVDRHCGDWLPGTGGQQRHAQLAAIIAEARDLGINTLREWALLCTLMARLDITTWRDGATDTAAYRWLTAPHLSAIERLEAALQAANPPQSPVMT
ncbi:DUF4123 domain-containing protein [Halomonas sp. ML-15]|uniref:DUF4123 domain-containing protein n=1 Tax=Halomonas sp. ML-15 TaxID=2773305 RepID=UPI00174654B6|nr:DUF4123 domain-containing protein [Halomonas sp. ML-15]MBD3895968.1 DUF4123 domain-containing protein [Halomonas sp. ML-15]